MATVSELLLKLSFQSNTADLKKLVAGLKELQLVSATTRRPSAELNAELRSMENQVRRAATAHMELGKQLSSVGTRMSLLVTLPIALFFKSASEAAMDYGVQVRKVDIIFGQFATNVQANAAKAAASLGLSKSSYSKAVGSLGTTLNEYGLPQASSYTMSRDLVKREADIAAFNGLTTSEVADAVQTAMAGGRTLALRKMLVSFSTSDITKEAQKLGLTAGLPGTPQFGVAGLSDKAKAIATEQLILDRSSAMEGAYNRQKDTTLGKLRTEQAEFQNLKITIGQDLVPVLNQLLNVGNGLLTMFNALPHPLQQTAIYALMLAATVGPVMKLVGAFIQLRTVMLGNEALGEAGLLSRMFGGAAAAGGGAALAGAGLASNAGFYGTQGINQFGGVVEEGAESGGLLAGSTAAGIAGVAAAFAAPVVIGSYLSARDSNSREKRAKAKITALSGRFDLSTTTGIQSAMDAVTQLQAQAKDDSTRATVLAKGGVPDMGKIKQAKTDYAALGDTLTGLKTDYATLMAAQTKADDELGYTPGLRSLINDYTELGKVADSTASILKTAMSGFDVVDAQVKLQTDEYNIKQQIGLHGTGWLRTVEGVGSSKLIAGDVGSIIDAKQRSGAFAGMDTSDILKTAQSMFAQQMLNVGITTDLPGVQDYIGRIQAAIDASGGVDVPMNLVPNPGWGRVLMPNVTRYNQQQKERQTVPSPP